MKRFPSTGRLAASILGVAALAATVSACAPLMVGGAAMTGAVVATDRRSSGAQLDDQGIELRAANRLRDAMGSRARISVTSYNRRALLTGEVANERDKALAYEIVAKTDNVASVFNELDITNSPTFKEKAEDTLLTGRVKAGLVDTKNLSTNSFKVVSERGSVFLMGRVTQREADQATEVARTTKGAQRVVRLFEIITEEELARMK
ncbi:MAG TPA: transporter [Hydrogenophaga sp.]|jgi:osmotically-inducible protein OsmY|uniref:BON domain-containing protein n=1 Tax=Hydrogenophaga TaxID=47420 RepID=UPI0008CF5169|nr:MULTISPECIES: BON domain-containing protein [Hydrogenophaga]MBU4182202.1 BON domain-containing protein [Gammaproteobacteria bacterium]OGA75487.1 MAG: transporter [Burkholderiales bacterium GWE1_65_30]OGA93613.1 MAG: transporter [Burkholderiales bacterium GWF1_66_17]OGB37410.1 MAG: transporter [Burkholderiales bacterium RIFCSPLOWO2_02_FULL_66_35]OGB38437.1 MAG: transporter [Burkholderiales bacterium RIFCSPHIGHO2_02_FULL_66_10]PKO27748.1 MAG: transporter [Betaproteobacteria bacterium HGW-Bet